MMTAKRKIGVHISVFYLCLIVGVALALIAMVFGLAYLRGVLADYEAVQPQYEAERIFDRYFRVPDYAELVGMSEMPGNLSPFETKDSLADAFDALYGGAEMSYAQTTGSLDGSLRYLVKAGGKKIAVFTLAPGAGEKSQYGFDRYALSVVELYIRPTERVTVSVPEGSTVYLNGMAVSEDYCTARGIETESCAHMPDGVPGITYATYTVNALLRAPEVTVMTEKGETAPLRRDEKTGDVTAEVVYDAALEAQYAEQMIKVAKLYAAYMQSDGTFASFSRYFERGTELYENTRTVANYFVWSHNGYSFRDVSASEFYAYDENTFSCRVKFTHLLHKTGFEDFVDYFDATFYLRRVGDEFLIYDRYNH